MRPARGGKRLFNTPYNMGYIIAHLVVAVILGLLLGYGWKTKTGWWADGLIFFVVSLVAHWILGALGVAAVWVIASWLAVDWWAALVGLVVNVIIKSVSKKGGEVAPPPPPGGATP